MPLKGQSTANQVTLLVLAESQGADRNRGSAPLGGYQPILSLSLSLFLLPALLNLSLSLLQFFSLCLFFLHFLILIIASYSPIVAAVASSADGICPLWLQSD